MNCNDNIFMQITTKLIVCITTIIALKAKKILRKSKDSPYISKDNPEISKRFPWNK